jgi:pSer/pThr/pTyr-binding forkhead associated (FHA) protein
MAKDILVKDKKRLNLQTWVLEEGFSTFGRDPASRFVLDDPSVSRSHGAFFLRERAGVLTLEDHGSTNGTLVNGVPIKRKILYAGDVVQIGDFQLYILQGSAAQGRPRPEAGSGRA